MGQAESMGRIRGAGGVCREGVQVGSVGSGGFIESMGGLGQMRGVSLPQSILGTIFSPAFASTPRQEIPTSKPTSSSHPPLPSPQIASLAPSISKC